MLLFILVNIFLMRLGSSKITSLKRLVDFFNPTYSEATCLITTCLRIILAWAPLLLTKATKTGLTQEILPRNGKRIFLHKQVEQTHRVSSLLNQKILLFVTSIIFPRMITRRLWTMIARPELTTWSNKQFLLQLINLPLHLLLVTNQRMKFLH